jgi:hypothetical protein
VAISSLLDTGIPQAEQKRTLSGKSVRQDAQAGMNFPDTVYLVGTGLLDESRVKFDRARGLENSASPPIYPLMCRLRGRSGGSPEDSPRRSPLLALVLLTSCSSTTWVTVLASRTYDGTASVGDFMTITLDFYAEIWPPMPAPRSPALLPSQR